jgi:asparagine synthase (glutamine-hydrolysing)
MSALFGRWNFDGAPLSATSMEQLRALLLPYGQDSEGSFSKEGISLLYRACHTTKESRGEKQPHIRSCGTVLMWDGRLDNREALIGELGGRLSHQDTDISIVAAAYARWDTDCFQKLLGDWALAIWEPRKRQLRLAKDFLGARHLYYSIHDDHIAWSTTIDPLVLSANREITFDEEYFAGWYASFPAAHLTPYAGIHAVPPACFVTLSQGRHTVHKYWHFDGSNLIRYRSDAEYEEHFRSVFAEAVRRRLRSDSPILAELSGGMDSSSIVCMADHVSNGPRVDTVSYYNELEPNWNERPYFSKVEEWRGRAGLHVDTGLQPSCDFACEESRPALLPGNQRRKSNPAVEEWVRQHGHRVILSGIGGDEVTGGVPTPLPELENLLARARFRSFARQLRVWAIQQRRPWFHLFRETIHSFLPPVLTAMPNHTWPGTWFRAGFVRRNRSAFLSYAQRCELFGALPSVQENLHALDALRRQLASTCPTTIPLSEKRYPHLDRDLLEFLYAVPREQLVRPGHRRSLMRRALAGIVPEEILNRKRKAFVSRAPIAAIEKQYSIHSSGRAGMMSASLGFVDSERFYKELEIVHRSQAMPSIALLRTLGVEEWLVSLREHGMLIIDSDTPRLVIPDIQKWVSVETARPIDSSVGAGAANVHP